MSQKTKSKFRQSAKWKKFRIHMKKKYKTDYVTGYPLRPGWNLHHMDLNKEHYEDITDEGHFRCLNKMMHEMVHNLYRYYVNDQNVINRLRQLLEVMRRLNSNERQETVTPYAEKIFL